MRISLFFILLCLLWACGTSKKSLLNDKSEDTSQSRYLALRQQIDRSPQDLNSRVALGDWYHDTGEFGQAIVQYDSALTFHPTSIRARLGKARALRAQDKAYDGLAEYLKVLEQSGVDSYIAGVASQIGLPHPIRQITTSDGDKLHARYSPAGDQIVFQSNVAGNWEVYRQSLQKSDSKRLTYEEGEDEAPVYSPDGDELLFTTTRGSQTSSQHQRSRDIYRMNTADGTELKRVVGDPSDDWNPVFAPEGMWMVFASDRADQRDGVYGDRQSDLYMYDFDQENITQLTHGFGDKSAPSISFRGDKIVYVNNVNGNFEIYEQHISETYGRRLVWGGGPKGGPQYSPNGKKIVFFEKIIDNFDIYLFDRGEERSMRLTCHPAMEVYPSFSPDGNRILFSSNRTGIFQIYEIDLTRAISKQELREQVVSLMAVSAADSE